MKSGIIQFADSNKPQPKRTSYFWTTPKNKGAFGVKLVDIKIYQPGHVGAEDVATHEHEEDCSKNTDQDGNDHVLAIVDAHAGHGFVGGEDCQGHLLEGNDGHANLGRKDTAEDHHGRIAVTLLVAAQLAYAVENAPANDCSGRGRGQAAEQEDGAQEGESEDPGAPLHKIASDKPQRDESGQAIVADGCAEHEDEEHHLHDRIAKALVQQHHWLVATYEHEGQKAGKGRPHDLYENPAIEYAKEDADEIHAKGCERFQRRQLAECEHDEQTDCRMQIVHGSVEALLCRGCLCLCCSHESFLLGLFLCPHPE